MTQKRKSLVDFPVSQLDRELILQGYEAQDPKMYQFEDREENSMRDFIMKETQALYGSLDPSIRDQMLKHVDKDDLAHTLIYLTREIDGSRGVFDEDNRKDFFQIEDKKAKENALSTTAIVKKDSLIDQGNGYSLLKTGTFGEIYNLYQEEPFYFQPSSRGLLFTGFLVDEDVVATAGHKVNRENVRDFRFIFGYHMESENNPVTRIPNDQVYQGIETLDCTYTRDRAELDWALVRLDRKVKGKRPLTLSQQEISCNNEVYVIGYPVGLPLKYAAGARICDCNETNFLSDLDIYSGNSGSPIFDSKTNEVVGMIIQGHYRDFRWTGKDWISVSYPCREFETRYAQCLRPRVFQQRFNFNGR